MVDIHSILADYHTKTKASDKSEDQTDFSHKRTPENLLIEVPDVFFDEVIVEYKLSRIEIVVLMYIYRRVWCYPNIHKVHGISPMMSHSQMSKTLNLTIEEVYSSLRKLEELEFIKTIRAGQYFSRKYFTPKLDEHFHQTYDDFEF